MHPPANPHPPGGNGRGRTELIPVLLSVTDLSVSFATAAGRADAVAGLSFTIDEEETLAIVGESGSGKSVSALAIMGLVPRPPGEVTAGRIMFQSRTGRTEDLLKARPARLREIRGNEIAMVFQEPLAALSPVFTIGEQIAETLRLHQRKDRAEAMQTADPHARRPRHFRAGDAGEELSAPDLRRHGAAGDDRHGTRLPAAPADRR